MAAEARRASTWMRRRSSPAASQMRRRSSPAASQNCAPPRRMAWPSPLSVPLELANGGRSRAASARIVATTADFAG
eukprot:4503342-Alexandrium_andersonii.AAC.2